MVEPITTEPRPESEGDPHPASWVMRGLPPRGGVSTAGSVGPEPEGRRAGEPVGSRRKASRSLARSAARSLGRPLARSPARPLGGVVAWPGGRAARVVAWPDGRAARAVAWPDGRVARVVAWPDGRVARVVTWPGGRVARVVTWPRGRSGACPSGGWPVRRLGVGEGEMASDRSGRGGLRAVRTVRGTGVSRRMPRGARNAGGRGAWTSLPFRSGGSARGSGRTRGPPRRGCAGGRRRGRNAAG